MLADNYADRELEMWEDAVKSARERKDWHELWELTEQRESEDDGDTE